VKAPFTISAFFTQSSRLSPGVLGANTERNTASQSRGSDSLCKESESSGDAKSRQLVVTKLLLLLLMRLGMSATE
jgi:hypothetical protein